MIEGQTGGDILQAIGKLWPDLNALELYAKAGDELDAAAKANPETIIGWLLLVRRDLFRRMVEIGDFAGALAATKLIESLIPKLIPDVQKEDDDEAGNGDQAS